MGSVNCSPPKTSSISLTETVTAMHDFKVTSYSLLDGMGVSKYVNSSTFSVGGCDWFVRFFPDGYKKDDKAAYISLFLYLGRGAREVRTKFTLSLLDKDGKASPLANFTVTVTITSPHYNFGYHRFVEKSKLQSSSCLNNDCLTIRCVVTVIKEPRTEDIKIMSLVEEPQSHLKQHLELMLKSGKGADVKFSVGDRLFEAHRYLLAARSPVFDAELFGPMKEKAMPCIKIDDIEPPIFEMLLHFIYTDSLLDHGDGLEEGKAAAMQHLLVAADLYGLDRLRLICERKLCENLDVETVATNMVLAEQHHCRQLREACIRFMASSKVWAAVIETDGFKHLVANCPLVLKEIFY